MSEVPITAGLTIAIVGPTATGKSDLALDVAEQLGGQIINTDAMQLYRGMDVGTAKLGAGERRGIVHHQIDVLHVRQDASVAAYQLRARADLAEIHAQGDPAITVGGSGLYVRALLDQLRFPPTEPLTRERLETRAEQEGAGVLHRELARVDPVAAASIDVRNTRRVIRALEVIELTGQPYSATMPRHSYEIPAHQFALDIDRDELRTRIARRAAAMFDGGLIEETRKLLADGLAEGTTAPKAVGYAQARAVIEGHLSVPEAVAQTAQATFALARRQLTWFAKDPRVVWLDPAADPLARILDRIAP